MKINKYVLIGGLILTGLLIMQLHNVFYHPPERGFDATGHMAYITYVQRIHAIPTAAEDWEFYQPPLYYLLASLMPNLVLVKFLGILAYFSILTAAYMLYKHYFKGLETTLLGVLVVATFPVLLYMSLSIGNEFFSTALITISLVYYLLHRKLTDKQTIILGILLAASLASKATSLVLIAAIGIDQLLLNKTWHKKLIPLTVLMITTIGLGGGYYIRNYMIYQNPLITPDKLPELFFFKQQIVERNFHFFTTLQGFLTLDLFQSHHYSFLSGTYFSWFYDAHNVIIPVQEFSKAGALLILLSIPIFVYILVGFVLTMKAFKEKDRILVIYTIMLLGSYVAYNIHLPYYSTVKGSFIMSMAVPLGYFFLRAWQKYQIKPPYMYGYLFIYTVLLIKNLWILDWWY
ncbi:glycosyltransferase family 39 protein [Candidatus Roizmanbacteria bacterium]|nr:MAG: glycosyltransferase family 39 protein [Candidatus Roizmanbacteria bacterium]